MAVMNGKSEPLGNWMVCEWQQLIDKAGRKYIYEHYCITQV